MKGKTTYLPLLALLGGGAVTHAQTWNGSTNTDWATAANWSSDPSLPVPGADIVIANSTTNNIGSLGGEDRVIGSFTFGDAGTRDTAFTVNTGTSNSLTIQGGLTASVTGVRPTFQGNVIIDGAQTWAIGGDTATVDLDRGVRLTRSGSVGSVTLNDDLTKTGTGSIEFLATTLSGAGNLIVNGGSVKVNAGSSALVTIGGSGNIQLNNDASLVFAKNSGTMSVTRDIVMNGTSSIIWGRGGTNFTTEVASAIQWNGTHNLSQISGSAGNFEFSGAWTGAGTVTRTGSQTLILSGDNTAFTGSLKINSSSTSGSVVIFGSTGFGATGDVLVVGAQNFNASLEVANGVTVNNSITLQRGGGSGNRAVLQLGAGTECAGGVTVNNTSNSGVAVINLQGNSAANASIVSGGVSFSELGTGDAIWFRGGGWGKLTGSIDAATGRVVIVDATKWEFSNASNTWGELQINNNGAIVTVGAANTLSATGVVTSANTTGTLRLNNQTETAAFDQTIAGLGTMVSVGLVVGTATLTLDTTADQTHSGSISGAISLVKDGAATQELAGTSTYTGTTIVSAGTLLVTGQLGATDISVAPGAIFGGTGTVGGDIDFASTALLHVEDIDTPLTIGGTVTFGSGFGIANLVGLDWDALDLSTPYTLISTSQTFTTEDIGNFGLANAAPVGTGRQAYFQDGSLQLVVIPEPAAALLGGLGLLLLLCRRRS